MHLRLCPGGSGVYAQVSARHLFVPTQCRAVDLHRFSDPEHSFLVVFCKAEKIVACPLTPIRDIGTAAEVTGNHFQYITLCKPTDVPIQAPDEDGCHVTPGVEDGSRKTSPGVARFQRFRSAHVHDVRAATWKHEERRKRVLQLLVDRSEAASRIGSRHVSGPAPVVWPTDVLPGGVTCDMNGLQGSPSGRTTVSPVAVRNAQEHSDATLRSTVSDRPDADASVQTNSRNQCIRDQQL